MRSSDSELLIEHARGKHLSWSYSAYINSFTLVYKNKILFFRKIFFHYSSLPFFPPYSKKRTFLEGRVGPWRAWF